MRTNARVALSLCVLVALIVLPKLAMAAVPMCDENAQTIAAPFPIMPTRGGTVGELAGCERHDFQFEHGQAPAPERVLTIDPPERMPPVSASWALSRKGTVVRVAAPDERRPRDEFRLGVFRPPQR